MSLALLDSLSLPGDPAKANEDAFGQDANAAVVIDGATPLGDGLMPGPSDAAWISQFGARRLMAHLRDGNGARKALRAALAKAGVDGVVVTWAGVGKHQARLPTGRPVTGTATRR